MLLDIAGWLIWGLSLFLCLGFAANRNPDGAVRMLSQRYSLLVAVGLALTLIPGVSRLHLLWWVPLAYPLNLLLFEMMFRKKAEVALRSMQRASSLSGVVGDGTTADFERWAEAQTREIGLLAAAEEYIESFSIAHRKLRSEPGSLIKDRAVHQLLLEVCPSGDETASEFRDVLNQYADTLNAHEGLSAYEEFGEDITRSENPIEFAKAIIRRYDLGIRKYVDEPKNITEERAWLSIVTALEQMAAESEHDKKLWSISKQLAAATIELWELERISEEGRRDIDDTIQATSPESESKDKSAE